MGRLLAQLFEITALFNMRLRPELVLLQKTMVTVEGVGRRIDPALDVWAAAEPVVARWIARELSPTARAAAFAREARAAVSTLARLAEGTAGAPPEPKVPPPGKSDDEATHPAIWFFAGAAVSALAFALGVWFRFGLAR